MTIIGKLLEEFKKIEQGLEISTEFRYNKEKPILFEKKKRWVKNPYIKISSVERNLLDSKIVQGEYVTWGKHTATIQTANYCYSVELFFEKEGIVPKVLCRRELQ